MAKTFKEYESPLGWRFDMKQLAQDCNLAWDDDDTNRLHHDHDEMICVYANLMTAKEYAAMERALKRTIRRRGYVVYAWNDVSGYRYWHAEGKCGDHNYIQVTVSVTGKPAEIDRKQLREDVLDLYVSLRHYDNRDEYWSRRMDEEETL